MKKTLLNEFERYELIENDKEEIRDIDGFSPTVALPLICSQKLKSENLDSIRKI